MVDKALLVARGDAPGEGADDGAGAGVPLGPLACMPVANRPLLEHALSSIFAAGVSEVAIVAEPGMRAFVEATVGRMNGRLGNVSVFEHTSSDGLAEVIELAQPVLDGQPFLLHLGDALCWDLADGLDERPIGADDAVVLLRGPSGRGPISLAAEGLTVVDGRTSRFGHLGVYVVGSNFSGIANDTGDREGGGVGLSAEARAAIGEMRRKGGTVLHRRKSGSWRYTVGSDNLLRANRVALERIQPERVLAELIETDIDGSVLIDRTACIQSSVIRGPVVIGPRARITNSYIGPYTTIDRDVEIEGTEVEHSVILDRVSIRHLGTRLETSVIGPNATVVRDFRLPRAVRLDVGPGSQVSLA